jgi:hypothetical protein
VYAIFSVGDRENVRCLLDSGASTSIVSRRFLKRAWHEDFLIAVTRLPRIVTGTGARLRILGGVKIPIVLSGPWTATWWFVVVDEFISPIVLGFDFLDYYRSQIDLNTLTLALRPDEFMRREGVTTDISIRLDVGCSRDIPPSVYLPCVFTRKGWEGLKDNSPIGPLPDHNSRIIPHYHSHANTDRILDRQTVITANKYCTVDIRAIREAKLHRQMCGFRSSRDGPFLHMPEQPAHEHPLSTTPAVLEAQKVVLQGETITQLLTRHKMGPQAIDEADWSLHKLTGDQDTVLQQLPLNAEHIAIGEEMAFSLPDVDLTETQRHMILNVIGRFRHCFRAKKDPMTLMVGHRPVKIRVREGAQPKAPPFYKMTPQKLVALREILDNMESQNIIRRVAPDEPVSWLSPTLMVRKSDGSYRFIVDLRHLNSCVEALPSSMPSMTCVRACLGHAQARCLSTLDVASAFFQIAVDPDSQHYLGFQTAYGVYISLCILQGYRQSPAIWCNVMAEIYQHHLYQSVIAYMDDMIIYSPDVASHIIKLHEVLQLAEQYNLKFGLEKITIAPRTLSYLGFSFSRDGYSLPLQKRVEFILGIPGATTVREVRSILGVVNYFHINIPGLQQIATPIQRLVRQDVPMIWDQNCQKAWQMIKDILAQRIAVAVPRPGCDKILTSDSSRSAIGWMLEQTLPDGRREAIAFGGKALGRPNSLMSSTECELVGIMTALVQAQEYIGTEPVTVQTDSLNCTLIKSLARGNNEKLRRWAHFLQRFPVKAYVHIPARANVVCDLFSRVNFDALVDGERRPEPIIEEWQPPAGRKLPDLAFPATGTDSPAEICLINPSEEPAPDMGTTADLTSRLLAIAADPEKRAYVQGTDTSPYDNHLFTELPWLADNESTGVDQAHTQWEAETACWGGDLDHVDPNDPEVEWVCVLKRQAPPSPPASTRQTRLSSTNAVTKRMRTRSVEARPGDKRHAERYGRDAVRRKGARRGSSPVTGSLRGTRGGEQTGGVAATRRSHSSPPVPMTIAATCEVPTVMTNPRSRSHSPNLTRRRRRTPRHRGKTSTCPSSSTHSYRVSPSLMSGLVPGDEEDGAEQAMEGVLQDIIGPAQDVLDSLMDDVGPAQDMLEDMVQEVASQSSGEHGSMVVEETARELLVPAATATTVHHARVLDDSHMRSLPPSSDSVRPVNDRILDEERESEGGVELEVIEGDDQVMEALESQVGGVLNDMLDHLPGTTGAAATVSSRPAVKPPAPRPSPTPATTPVGDATTSVNPTAVAGAESSAYLPQPTLDNRYNPEAGVRDWLRRPRIPEPPQTRPPVRSRSVLSGREGRVELTSADGRRLGVIRYPQPLPPDHSAEPHVSDESEQREMESEIGRAHV